MHRSAARQGTMRRDAVCQATVPPDAACQSTVRLYATGRATAPGRSSQGMFHPDAAHVLQMQSVKANIVWMTLAMAPAFWMRSVRAFFLLDAARVLQTQRVIVRTTRTRASVVRTMRATASAFQTRRVRVFFLLDAVYVGKCTTDDACHGICLLDE